MKDVESIMQQQVYGWDNSKKIIPNDSESMFFLLIYCYKMGLDRSLPEIHYGTYWRLIPLHDFKKQNLRQWPGYSIETRQRNQLAPSVFNKANSIAEIIEKAKNEVRQ